MSQGDCKHGHSVAALLANAGHGLGRAFLDQDFSDINHVIDTNITGTIYLTHRVGRQMRASGQGRILFTGSIAGFMPGTFQAVDNGTKALDTKVGTQGNKADPAQVARIGFDAMMQGEADVVAGMKNKLQVAMASFTPAEVLAEQHRKMAEPGSARK